MWKKVRIPLIAIIALALLTAFFSWQLDFLNLPMRVTLEKISGQSVSFQEINYRFFNRISIENLTIGKSFRCKSLSIYFNPWKLVTSINHPQKALTHVHLNRPWISADEDLYASLKNIRTGDNVGDNGDVRISWDKAEIANSFAPITQLSGQVKLAEKTSGKMSGKARGHQLSISLTQEGSSSTARGEIIGKITGGDVNVEMKIKWSRSDDESFVAVMDAPKIQWGDFALQKSTGSFRLGKTGFSAIISNSGGSMRAEGKDGGNFRVRGELSAASILQSATGQFNLSFEKSSGTFTGFVKAAGFGIGQICFGNMNISFRDVGEGIWSCGGTIEPANYSFNGVIRNKREVEVYLQAGRTGFGKISGNMDPLRLDLKLMNWPAENMPLPGGMFADLKGVLAVTGSVSKDNAKLDMTAKDVQIVGTKPESFSAHLLMKTGYWFYQANALSNRWRVSGRILGDNDWDSNAEFNSLPMEEYLPWLHCDWPVGARISGTVKYSSKQAGEAKLAINNIFWDKTPVGNGKLNLVLTPESLEIKECSIHAGKGTMTGHAHIGLDADKNDCDLGLIFYNFPFRGNVLKGPLKATGKLLEKKGHRIFNGSLASADFKVGEWSTKRIKAKIELSEHLLSINELMWDPLIDGNAILDFENRAISGKISLKDVPIGRIVRFMDGHLKGMATISGSIDAPHVRMEYAIPDTRCNGISFEQKGVAIYRDKSIFAERIRLSSGTGSIELSGKAWPDMNLKGNIESCSAQLLGMAAGISLPVGGLFTGPLKIDGNTSSPVVSLEMAGAGVSAGNITFSECKGKFRYSNGVVDLDSMSAKSIDSEFHLLKGSQIDIKARRYHVASQWRNIHLGPVDCFGDINVSGTWDVSDKQFAYSGVVDANNFWINQHNIEHLSIGFSYHDGMCEFRPQENNAIQMSGIIDAKRWPQIRFDRWSLVSREKGKLSLDGEVGAQNWQFTLSGTDVAADVVSEIADLPVNLSGNLDINIVGRGALEQPLLEGSINISNGSVSDVPFESVNVQLSVRQDVLTLTRARLWKKDQYAISATGFCPFFLTSTGKKRVMNKPVDMTLSIEEGTLNLLTALTSDIKSADGSLRAQARITGTLAQPVTNGYLKVTNGEINSKRYFTKMTGLDVDLQWKDNLLNIRDLSGRVGDGHVAGAGTIKFDGFKPKEYALSFESQGKRGVPLSIPELPIPSPLFKSEDWEFFSNLSHGEPRFALKFGGPAEKPVLSGWIELENTHFTYPSLAKGGGGETILDPLWPKLMLDLVIRSGKNTWYDNELASVNIMGEIKLSGKWLGPSVHGKIESVRGTISYIGTEFKVKQATLEIVKDSAYLEAEAESEIYNKTPGETDVVQMFIDKANIERIQPRFVSKNNPDWTPEKALARATGIDPETYTTTDQEYLLRQQMIRLIDSTLTTPLARNLLRRSGIVDSFRVQYLSQEPIKPVNPANPTLTELLYGTKYSMEKYLTDRMLFGYSITFDQIQNRLDLRHELELSYRWKKNIFLKGVYELETNNPLRQHDRRITVEQQWRFGWPKKKK